jgi:hypothetical protein
MRDDSYVGGRWRRPDRIVSTAAGAREWRLLLHVGPLEHSGRVAGRSRRRRLSRASATSSTRRGRTVRRPHGSCSEILPNLSSTIVVFVPLMLANAILLEAASHTWASASIRPLLLGKQDLGWPAAHPGRVLQRARSGHHAHARGDEPLRRRCPRRVGSTLQDQDRPLRTWHGSSSVARSRC